MSQRERGSNRKNTTLSPDEVNINEPRPQIGHVHAVFNKNGEELTNVDNKGRSKIHIKRRHEETKKPKKTKKRSAVTKKPDYARLGLETPPELSQEVTDFIKEIGGTDVNLVIMKALFQTDLEKHQDRLSIPVSREVQGLMTEIEEQDVANGGVDVNLVEPVGLNVCSTKLRKWGKNNQYALTTGWNGFIDRNNEVLRVGSIVQVWSFRINGQLWSALV